MFKFLFDMTETERSVVHRLLSRIQQHNEELCPEIFASISHPHLSEGTSPGNADGCGSSAALRTSADGLSGPSASTPTHAQAQAQVKTNSLPEFMRYGTRDRTSSMFMFDYAAFVAARRARAAFVDEMMGKQLVNDLIDERIQEYEASSLRNALERTVGSGSHGASSSSSTGCARYSTEERPSGHSEGSGLDLSSAGSDVMRAAVGLDFDSEVVDIGRRGTGHDLGRPISLNREDQAAAAAQAGPCKHSLICPPVPPISPPAPAPAPVPSPTAAGAAAPVPLSSVEVSSSKAKGQAEYFEGEYFGLALRDPASIIADDKENHKVAWAREEEEDWPEPARGYATKEGHLFTTWKNRWFELERGMLRYYEDDTLAVKKGEMSLVQYTLICGVDSGNHCIILEPPRPPLDGTQRALKLIFRDEVEALMWMLKLEAHIERVTLAAFPTCWSVV